MRTLSFEATTVDPDGNFEEAGRVALSAVARPRGERDERSASQAQVASIELTVGTSREQPGNVAPNAEVVAEAKASS